jgi:hypothetical protein
LELIHLNGGTLEDTWKNIDPYNVTGLSFTGFWSGGDCLSPHADFAAEAEADSDLTAGAVARIVNGAWRL